MKEEFMIERNGKPFVLFAGLLDEAHQNGLRGIGVELVQLPTSANGDVAVVKATVEMEDGRSFSEIGDAAPDNVSRNIVPHIIRMAATRAKARALRDAVNIGVTALEELSDGDGESPRTGAKRTNVSSSTDGSRRRPETQGSDNQQQKDREEMPATDKQLGFLNDKIEQSSEWETVKEWEEAHRPLKTLTRGEASKAINAL